MSTATLHLPTPGIAEDDLYEIVDGKRIGTPPMPIYAVFLATKLVIFLGKFADATQVGRAVAEGLFHLPAPINRDRRPDVAFVSFDRWPKNRSIPRTDNAWNVVPNLATEVVSPTDSVVELEKKIVEYFQSGVELVWVVHPDQSKIHVYQSPTQIQVLTMTDVLDGGTVLPGFRLPLTELFAEPPEDAVP